MTRYASSDVRSFHNSACPTGGHRRTVTNQKEVTKNGAPPEYKEPRLVISCPACEPHLIGKDSWGDSEHSAPLTPDEEAERAAAEQQSLAVVGQLSASLAAQARDLINQQRA